MPEVLAIHTLYNIQYIHTYIVVWKLFFEGCCEALSGLVAPLSVRIAVSGIPLEDHEILHTYIHT